MTTTHENLAAQARAARQEAQEIERQRSQVAQRRRQIAHEMRDAGMTYRAIADATDVSIGMVQRLLFRRGDRQATA